MSALVRIGTAFGPLVLTPALLILLAYGPFNLGGGEKDIILALAWAVWSLAFAICALALWGRGWPLGRALKASSFIAFLSVTIIVLMLAGMGTLGFRGI